MTPSERIDSAITRAAAEAAHLAALVVYMSESTSLSDERMKKIAGEIKRVFSLEPCGHLVTSQVERDGKQVCEQCELEAEIVQVLRSLRPHISLVVKRDAEVGARDELAQMHVEELERVDALLAKLEGKM